MLEKDDAMIDVLADLRDEWATPKDLLTMESSEFHSRNMKYLCSMYYDLQARVDLN
jgi:hypothetical protein